MTAPSTRPLGRLLPPDFEHVERWPLRALAAPLRPSKVPVCTGFTWWPEYDRPARGSDGRWRILPTAGRNARGGHAFVFKPKGVDDPANWWKFYDQGAPGAAEDPSGCVGFSQSRCMSELNRRRYSGGWLYHQAKAIDGTPLPHEGTYVRSGFEVLRTIGHVRVVRGGGELPPDPAEGITTYRWATTAEEVRDVLGYGPAVEELPMLQSWGRDGYPHEVLWPLTEVERQLTGWDGECGVVTDR